MTEVILQRLDRVQVVLRQAVQSGGCGAERIQQRDLDQVVAIFRGGDEAARFTDL